MFLRCWQLPRTQRQGHSHIHSACAVCGTGSASQEGLPGMVWNIVQFTNHALKSVWTSFGKERSSAIQIRAKPCHATCFLDPQIFSLLLQHRLSLMVPCLVQGCWAQQSTTLCLVSSCPMFSSSCTIHHHILPATEKRRRKEQPGLECHCLLRQHFTFKKHLSNLHNIQWGRLV